LAGNADPLFQWHHQPFAYFDNYAPGTQGQRSHLQDETDFFNDLYGDNLPAVSFIKPLGPDNEHPGYTNLLQGQQHVANIVDAVQNSSAWDSTAIIVTYDENGGRWDHVSPPVRDEWGPGSRVPALIISPFARSGYVDHTQYDTSSILKTIEEIWNLQPLNQRDANAPDLRHAFNFSSAPRGSHQPDPALSLADVSHLLGINLLSNGQGNFSVTDEPASFEQGRPVETSTSSNAASMNGLQDGTSSATTQHSPQITGGWRLSTPVLGGILSGIDEVLSRDDLSL
jgi:phospholipase C